MPGLLREDTNMDNPTKEGYYTTVFRDGSIIHANLWMVFPDGHKKWYWNEECRGGVIAWNEIPEGGYKFHRWYKLPEEELKELLEARHLVNALDKADAYNYEIYNKAIRDYLDSINCETFQDAVENDLYTYYSGYKVE